MANTKTTPLMEQYWSMKSAHADKIMLFRMGDFFEMFYDDAQTAAPVLGIALTQRNKKSGDATPMCGVPHYTIGLQINKLLSHGFKVAICDQVEDPQFAKGLVKREVTRILTPGMIYDPDNLSADRPNYLAAFDDEYVAFMEATTGESFYYPVKNFAHTLQLLKTLEPAELVCDDQQAVVELPQLVVSFHNHLHANEAWPKPCRRLISYAVAMQGEAMLQSLSPWERRDGDFRLLFSESTIRHLELFQTYKGEKNGSLYHTLNRCKTAGGARLLRQWMQFPLTEITKIKKRQQAIGRWTGSLATLNEIRQDLLPIGDLQRKLGKLGQPHCHPRDLQALGNSLLACLKVLPFTEVNDDRLMTVTSGAVDRLAKTLVAEIPHKLTDGGFIAQGVSENLDELIDLATNSQRKVEELEAREREATGIPSLKVRYNSVFGYYIEVTNTHQGKVPTERYMRKQTLANAERYVTDELNELEKKVVTARTHRGELENEIFGALKQDLLASIAVFLQVANAINQLDVETALAWLAVENNYCCPELSEAGPLQLTANRHAVVEQFMSQRFVANDVHLDPHQCLLITGPNMAGKSTLMRQVAVTVIMAQMGSFVPAKNARLPIIDKIFTRIGASDFLTEGLSTFMVEMTETAEMLSQATSRSLVILDEVGRGTSTYDGMSLAQSILEHLVVTIQPMTMFATHYHELTALAGRYPGAVLNYHMAISDKQGELNFLYSFSAGPARKSYGIQVAELAGLPKPVIKTAKALLRSLEDQAMASQQMGLFTTSVVEPPPEPAAPILNDILNLDIKVITPLEALNKISQWQMAVERLQSHRENH